MYRNNECGLLGEIVRFSCNIEDAARISPLGDLLRDGRRRRDLSILYRLSQGTGRTTDAEVGKNDLKRIRLLSVDLDSPVPNGRFGP